MAASLMKTICSTVLNQNRILVLQKGCGRLPTCSRRQANPMLTLAFVQHRNNSQSSAVTAEEDDALYKKIVLDLKGHDVAVLNSYEKFVSMAAKELEIDVDKIWTPPKDIQRYTVLKSVHVYKKHRVQYETRTQFRTIELSHLTGSTAETFLEYIQRNLPEGLGMKVTKHQLESIPEHIKAPGES